MGSRDDAYHSAAGARGGPAVRVPRLPNHHTPRAPTRAASPRSRLGNPAAVCPNPSPSKTPTNPFADGQLAHLARAEQAGNVDAPPCAQTPSATAWTAPPMIEQLALG